LGTPGASQESEKSASTTAAMLCIHWLASLVNGWSSAWNPRRLDRLGLKSGIGLDLISDQTGGISVPLRVLGTSLSGTAVYRPVPAR
jgi:hypothetical protein